MTTLNPRNDALVRSAELTNFAETISVLNLHCPLLALQHKFLMFRWHFGPWFVKIDALLLGKSNQHAMEILSVS